MVAGRIVTSLWFIALGFLALAQPAHALFGSPNAALVAQILGAVLFAAAFTRREALRRQAERLVPFLVDSRGLRALVRSLAVGTLAASSAEAAADTKGAADALVAEPGRAALSRWRDASGVSSAATAETLPQTAASAPRRSTPSFPTTTA